MMDIRAIHNEADYVWALEQIEPYFSHEPEPGTPEGDRFDVLSTLIAAYENRRYEIPVADPIDILHFAIEHLGRSQSDLAEVLGSRSRASEILRRHRPLTLDMIRAISRAWHLPAGTLTAPYEMMRGSA